MPSFATRAGPSARPLRPRPLERATVVHASPPAAVGPTAPRAVETAELNETAESTETAELDETACRLATSGATATAVRASIADVQARCAASSSTVAPSTAETAGAPNVPSP